MKLGEIGWWPKTWNTRIQNTANGQDIPRQQIIEYGILENCEVKSIGLIIAIDYRGKDVFGLVASFNMNGPGNLYKLRDFLLDHTGESVATIENLEVEPHQFDR
jgi:hypothetical protein